MLEFAPVGSLRRLGRQVELRKFNAATKDYNSVEKLAASVMFRFCMDKDCPAIFIKRPSEGDEPLEGLRYERDFEETVLMDIFKKMEELALDNFGTDDIIIFKISEKTILAIKKNFMEGDWSEYAHECSGKDGISIPLKSKCVSGR